MLRSSGVRSHILNCHPQVLLDVDVISIVYCVKHQYEFHISAYLD